MVSFRIKTCLTNLAMYEKSPATINAAAAAAAAAGLPL
jgi:hypothetical protein